MTSVTRNAATRVAAKIEAKIQKRPRSARRNWWKVIGLWGRRSEEAFAHEDHVVCLHHVGEARVDALDAAAVGAAADLDAALRAARGDAAAQRDRLHHRHVRLEPVGAALL